jgi:hypothetical protein
MVSSDELRVQVGYAVRVSEKVTFVKIWRQSKKCVLERI